ncbi:MAG TPA: dicarboxylate/amino acid:cation symporter [Balneolaceae bacterium]|nr:dicarboxylate/amino acid:cation symporter [Balneolaceae bacterium]
MANHSDIDNYEDKFGEDVEDEMGQGGGMELHTKIITGLIVGLIAGLICSLTLGPQNSNLNWVIENITQPLGQVWLRLLLMIVIPLILSAIIIGIAGMGNVKKLGKVGLKTFLYVLIISGISVVIGVTMVNLIQPGKTVSAETAAALQAEYSAGATALVSQAEADKAAMDDASIPVLTQIFSKIIPRNPFDALVGLPNLLHLMFFAIILGIATTLVDKKTATPFIGFFEALFEISVKIINAIMWLAPYAVACLVFSSVASFGMDLLVALLWFIVTVLGGLFIHAAVVYSASVYYLSALSPIDFFRRVKTTAITAFSTSSSNATLPTALRESEENLGVSEKINSFVLTIGATANQNGTALYEGVTVIFIAQLAGVDLGLAAQIGVAYLAILGGIGTAGVPGGSLPYIVIILISIGVNPALIGIILGVDRILDMCRTAVNVVGDITAATYVNRSEGYPLKGQLSPPPVKD